jgi:hypothetical protein
VVCDGCACRRRRSLFIILCYLSYPQLKEKFGFRLVFMLSCADFMVRSSLSGCGGTALECARGLLAWRAVCCVLCAVLCCAVLCCAVLCCAVLCCDVM